MRIIRPKHKTCENCSHNDLSADNSVCCRCIDSVDKFNFAPNWPSGTRVAIVGFPDSSLRDEDNEEDDE